VKEGHFGGVPVLDPPERQLRSELFDDPHRLQREPESRERMCLAPQGVCRTEWLNPNFRPPSCFVATSMNLTMMSTAQWDRRPSAGLCANRRWWGSVGCRPQSKQGCPATISDALDHVLGVAQGGRDRSFGSSTVEVLTAAIRLGSAIRGDLWLSGMTNLEANSGSLPGWSFCSSTLDVV
jgi:hypothetical protein